MSNHVVSAKLVTLLNIVSVISPQSASHAEHENAPNCNRCSVVSVSVCLLDISPAKTAESIEMPINHVLGSG